MNGLAYEVTKRIKGRDYRYRVEGVVDPQTGRTRSHWRYLGRLDGDDVVAPSRPGVQRVTHDELIAVIARLLETRDASRVTVGVIVHVAGISAATFYRHFPDRFSALAAAVASLCAGVVRDLPSLGGRLGSAESERARLSTWFAAFHRAALHRRAVRWFVTGPDRERLKATPEWSSIADEPQRLLTAYLERLHRGGLAHIDHAGALATALLQVNASFVREIASNHDDETVVSRWAELFPLIERAVFSSRLAAA